MIDTWTQDRLDHLPADLCPRWQHSPARSDEPDASTPSAQPHRSHWISLEGESERYLIE